MSEYCIHRAILFNFIEQKDCINFINVNVICHASLS